MTSKSIFWILLLILLLSSCYKTTKWEDVTMDYAPVLNVLGIISLDENIDSFVGVYRTTELTETSMIFTGIVDTILWYDDEEGTEYSWLDSLYEPAGVIDSAVVTIFTDAETYVFEFDSQTRKYKYNGFTAIEDKHYNLRIEVNGFDPITGELITPFIPHIDSSLNDTLPYRSTYTINWNNNQTSAENGLLTGKLIDNDVKCGGEFYSLIEFDSEEFIVFPQWCDPDEDNLDYATLRIRFIAMDDNYYQYFANDNYQEYSNFLFETSGTSGQSIGVEGGFGVFGAFASDTLTRVLSP